MSSPVVQVARVGVVLIAISIAIIGALAIFDFLPVDQALDVAMKLGAVIVLFAAVFVVVALVSRKSDE
jgi:hypothetical protein